MLETPNRTGQRKTRQRDWRAGRWCGCGFMQRFSRPKRRGKLQDRLDCHGPAALAMTE
jgi:hypothetical protein